MSRPMPRLTSLIAMMRRALAGLEIIIGLAHGGIGPLCIGPPALALANEGLESIGEEVRLGSGRWGLDQVDLLPGSMIMLVWSGPVSSF